MVRLAELRARERHPVDAVRALHTAYLTGHPATPAEAFKVADQLAAWNLLPEARTFADQGRTLAGPNLLLAKNSGSFEPSRPATYARILTRRAIPTRP